MGIFSRKKQETRTPSDLAAINLNQRLEFKHFNYHDIRISFISHAFPNSPMFADRSLASTQRSSAEVRTALERFIASEISEDELTNEVFGLSTFAEFVDMISIQKKSDCGGASSEVLKKLAQTEWSQEWDRSLDTARVHQFVWDCLGDSGSRAATHSGLVHDGWRHQDAHAIHYAEAAKLGFVAVAEVFGKSKSSFGWNEDSNSQDRLLTAVVIPCPANPNPIDVLSERHRKSIDERCEQIAFRLNRMYGERSGSAVLPYTFNADSFFESLTTASRHGALLAAIGLDPSGCRIYSGYGEERRQVAPSEFPWLSKRNAY
jgi:hypothetical protein